MSWKIKEKYRKLLADEVGGAPKGWGGKISICLVYPNNYHTAMSNLGFQTVHALLNGYPDVLCERAFLPDREEEKEYATSRTPLLSLETQRPLSDFDVIAFSVSFESDYQNLPHLFNLCGIPALSAERNSSMPLVIAGGAALFLNPEPIADFIDLVLLGEAEALLPGFLDLLRKHEERGSFLVEACHHPGFYVPCFYQPQYDQLKTVEVKRVEGAPDKVARVWERALDEHPTVSQILSPSTEFSDMYLVEVSRGCPRGCRFCAAGFIYLPYRHRSVEAIESAVDEGLQHHQKIGLVGAAVSDHHDIGKICRHIASRGGKVSVSSLRLDRLDEELVDLLKESGHKTISLAPEGGSQRLRNLIKKGITEEQILSACEKLVAKDILNLKLYFIIGLPTETMEDLEEMASLVIKIREKVVDAARRNKRLGEVILSVNPFVPKPFTPLQWCGMENIKSLEKKVTYLHNMVGKLANVRLKMESLKEAQVQAVLSRGDRRLSQLLLVAYQEGSLKRGAKRLGIDLEALAERNIPLDELLPWDLIETVNKEHLRKEYRHALEL